MRNFILSLLIFTHSLAFASNNGEVTGHFVIAPISSEQCEASAITPPTYGLPSDSELFVMLTSFIGGIDNTSGIEPIIVEEQPIDVITTIYDFSGRQLPALQPGLNIVIDKDGNRKKVFVAE